MLINQLKHKKLDMVYVLVDFKLYTEIKTISVVRHRWKNERNCWEICSEKLILCDHSEIVSRKK